MGSEFAPATRFKESFAPELQERITLHNNNDMASPIASGSVQTDGMLIIPCSMGTLAAISMGMADNLLRRAADVTLKEQRPLVIVPRETPLSPLHLENMLKLSRLGVAIVPPVPAWYHHPTSLREVEDTIVGRALDSLNIITEDLYQRWRSPKIEKALI
jgi:4-hydroxy-3-polyprenylbenzoate decarboxylase